MLAKIKLNFVNFFPMVWVISKGVEDISLR